MCKSNVDKLMRIPGKSFFPLATINKYKFNNLSFKIVKKSQKQKFQ